MQFKTLIAAQLAALAAAAPAATTTSASAVATPSAFNILTLRSGSAIHFNNFNAALSNIFLQLPKPNATCDAESDGAATFYLSNGELYLYSTENPPQKLYADRSGMGKLSVSSRRGNRLTHHRPRQARLHYRRPVAPPQRRAHPLGPRRRRQPQHCRCRFPRVPRQHRRLVERLGQRRCVVARRQRGLPGILCSRR